ncbi:MAG: hypothetical protein ACOX1O_05455 [Eggerthellaceae bacterium]|jgi:hypothetical protein
MGIEHNPDYGMLQRVVDTLFKDAEWVDRLDVLVLGETFDLPSDLIEIIEILPPGFYNRQTLCDQLNSAINGHAWGMVYGTVK